MSLLRRLADIARSHLHTPPPRPTRAVPPGTGEVGAGEGGAEAGEATVGEATAVNPRRAAYYANLELPYGAPLLQVRAAWRRLMKRYHPDLHSQDPDKRKVADELTARLTEAYRQLEAELGDGG